MRRKFAIVAMVVAVAPAALRAQTHAVKKPETVVRAVAVYEWTGDEAKPTASRLVPVSVFINSQLEDAGVYLARPVPFALDTGTVFEVQKAGVPEGTLELAYERHLEGTGDTPFDDGWLGYGKLKPKPGETVLAAKQRGPLPQVVASGGNKPHFANKTDDSSSAAGASADDPNKPTMRRRTDSSADSSSATTAPASDSNKPVLKRPDTASTTGDSTAAEDDDPNRPVLLRRSGSDADSASSGSSAPATTGSSGSTGSTTAADDSNRPTMRKRSTDSSDSSNTSSPGSSDDADRPTLKKRTPAQAKQAQRKGDQASVASVGELNDDPDRPTLHRGAPSTSPDFGIPPLNGLPADMHQMAAVSDAKDRPEHDFARPWESASERDDVMEAMEAIARAKLATYDVPAPAPAAAAAPAPAPATKTAATRTKKPVAPPAPPPPPPVALADESLRGYTLSFGGAATFVYTATSPGAGGATRYVTVVAQQDPQSVIRVALSSVTDSTHLDRTPWMRLVDVVDAEASNRASLLFEMREEKARQFALYRVIGARAEKIFETGTTE